MIIAIWIIAICGVIRIVQNFIQLRMLYHDTGTRDNAYAEFVKSLKTDDREMVKRILEAFARQYEGEEHGTD